MGQALVRTCLFFLLLLLLLSLFGYEYSAYLNFSPIKNDMDINNNEIHRVKEINEL